MDSGLVDRFRRPRHSLWCVSGIRGVVALDLACVLAAIEEGLWVSFLGPSDSNRDFTVAVF